ncbi:MAG: trypsin-like peptidase domain-containing protein [Spirochaetia bacterium]
MRPRHMTIAAIAALSLLAAVPAVTFSLGQAEKTSGQGSSQGSSGSGQKANPQALAEATKNLETIQYSFREVAKKVLPVVVEVDVTEQAGNPQTVNPFDWFFNQQPGNRGGQPRIQQGLGSGIVVKRSGDTYYILTNNHVVGTASTITVKLQDQTVFSRVKLVGKDTRRDLAVVSFTSSTEIPVADLGDSSELQVGDLVLAVGNPFGFENTVTMGIVSAVGRSSPSTDVATNTDYIQTDAAINQGNSGGALVNIKGEVVGINTWIAAPTGGSIGLGFAVPINNAKKAINDFINKGKVEYGWLGVQIADPTGDTDPGVAKDLRVDGVKGAMLLNVYRGQPSEKAGLLPGDFITRVNGQDIANANKLTQVVGDLLADRPYDFELIRNGERVKLTIRLAVRPDEGSDALSYKNLWPGLRVVHVNDQFRQQSGDTSIPRGFDGVMIGFVAAGNTPDDQSPAAIAGFRSYDVITQMNGRDVHTVMDFYKALNDKSRKDVSFKVTRNGTDVTIGLTR